MLHSENDVKFFMAASRIAQQKRDAGESTDHMSGLLSRFASSEVTADSDHDKLSKYATDLARMWVYSLPSARLDESIPAKSARSVQRLKDAHWKIESYRNMTKPDLLAECRTMEMNIEEEMMTDIAADPATEFMASQFASALTEMPNRGAQAGASERRK